MAHKATGTKPATCAKHGDFESTQWSLDPMPRLKPGYKELPPILQPFWSQCPVCEADMQIEADAHDEAIRGGLTAKQRFRAAMEREANIPERFKDSQVWNWQHGIDQQRRCWDWARDYAGQFDLAISTGRSGVFCGAPGTGKTHLAIGLMRHIIEKGGTGYYTTVMDMLGRIKDTFHRDAHETEQKVIEHLCRVDLLVIDEVGKQLDSNYEIAQFFRIIDRRYRALKPVLLVSNLPKDKFLAFVDAAVIDRLREAGGKLLVFDWASQRSTKKPEQETP